MENGDDRERVRGSRQIPKNKTFHDDRLATRDIHRGGKGHDKR